MRSTLAALTILTLASGCSDYTVTRDSEPEYTPVPASISGRVCDPTGRSWLSDAMAYTNIENKEGKITDVRKAYSDRDGHWSLTELAPNREYTIYVQHGTEVLETHEVWVSDGDEVELDEPDCFDPMAMNIALVSGDYDDIDLLLLDMGFANFTVIDGGNAEELGDFLSDVDALKQFDVIFFNGGHEEDGIFYDKNPANTIPDTVVANLQEYVAGGGSVYGSDWSYDVIERAWPDAIDFLGDDRTADAAQLGEYDLVSAKVTDESLSDFLGTTTVEIEYDLPVWPPMQSVEPYVSIHLTGDVQYREGQSSYYLSSVPLLVSFSGGEGRVAFSTFRVAANQSSEMVLILQYMLGQL